ncbi:probable plastid-lipid-associated protein 8, chloroplastic [Diospyros lotus]|uniref:probable plastid-lipid-associated protein 8, chloroplastic n=1 Tax=Diospyros lotus TaxID=55363 RepID=UPI002255BD1B|nr:probable plastid-lipid-associated protein 8, chloroplastic [Diospyros lotus]
MAAAASSAAMVSVTLTRGLEPDIFKFKTPQAATFHRHRRNRPPVIAARAPPPLLPSRGARKVAGIVAAISSEPIEKEMPRAVSSPQSKHLVDSIIAKVTNTDRGVLLTTDEHNKVAEVAEELRKFCVDEPVKCPLIFGDWDVVYCSVPTSPGGGYRTALGRLVFNTKEMIQVVEAPDTVRNKVSFSAFGFLDGEVSLKGKLKALDEKWIQVVFEAPKLRVGGLKLQYGGESEVKLEITYIDEKIRLGKGSRGSLFVFQRRKQAV